MLNKIMLIGNLGRDPELNVTGNGTPFAKFSLAVSRSYKANSGERREETEWFNIVAWQHNAEFSHTYLRKGSKVYVEGRLTQRKYTDKNGVERTMVEVIASDVQNLTPKSAQSGSGDFLAASGAEDAFSLDSGEEFP